MMCRSSTMTVGVPVGASSGFFCRGALFEGAAFSGAGFSGTVLGCTLTSVLGTPCSSAFTSDSSSVSSATAVLLLGSPEVPEAEDECEHCPEYAAPHDPGRRRMGMDQQPAHELDVGDGGIEEHHRLHPARQRGDLLGDGEEDARGVEPGAHDEGQQLV